MISPPKKITTHKQSPDNFSIVRLATLLLWVAFLMKLSIFYTDMHFGVTIEWEKSTLELYAQLKTASPFKWRFLVPGIVHFLTTQFGFSYYICFYYIEVINWFILFVMSYYALTFLNLNNSFFFIAFLSTTVAIPLCYVLCVPVSFFSSVTNAIDIVKQFYSPYDLASAMFVMTAYVSLFKLSKEQSNKYISYYYFTFFLASINRETALLFTFTFFAVMKDHFTKKNLYIHLVAQLIIFLTIRSYIYLYFQGASSASQTLPQTPYEFQLLYNINQLTLDCYLKKILFSYTSGGILLVILFAYRKLSSYNKIFLYFYCLPVICIGLFLGVIAETRIFAELMPLFWICLIQILALPCPKKRPDNDSSSIR